MIFCATRFDGTNERFPELVSLQSPIEAILFMALTAGSNISQYQIIANLGSGGMGEVYLARDERLRRKVALNLLFDEATKNEDWVCRFEQEAYAESALSHPKLIGQSDTLRTQNRICGSASPNEPRKGRACLTKKK